MKINAIIYKYNIIPLHTKKYFLLCLFITLKQFVFAEINDSILINSLVQLHQFKNTENNFVDKKNIYIIKYCKVDTSSNDYILVSKKIMYKENLIKKVNKIIKYKNNYILIKSEDKNEIEIDSLEYYNLLNSLYNRNDVIFEGQFCIFQIKNNELYKYYCLNGGGESCDEDWLRLNDAKEYKINLIPKEIKEIKKHKRMKHRVYNN